MPDYIPAPDDKFDRFQSGFGGYMVASKTARRVSADEATAVTGIPRGEL